VDRELLLEKLKIYGFGEKALKWFSNYLSNRKQIVLIDNTPSTAQEINIGVVQGSILAPLLFIIYINDMKNVLSHVTINIFADDTAMSLSEEDPKVAYQKFNEDMDIIADWL
jgi:ribonucleases P/MRP protein subunit RPP40